MTSTMIDPLPTASGWAGARDRAILRKIRSSRRSSQRHELGGVLRVALFAVAMTKPATVRAGDLAEWLGLGPDEADQLVSEAVDHGLLAPGSTSRRLDLMTADYLRFMDLAEYAIPADYRPDVLPSGSYAELSDVNLTLSFTGRAAQDDAVGP